MSLLSLPKEELLVVIDIIQKQNKKTSSDMLNNLFKKSVKGDFPEDIVKLLLQCKQVDPSIPGDVAIRQMAKKGYVDVVELLLKDIRVNPSALNCFNNNALMNACNEGHITVVKLLLQDPRVDPKVVNNKAIKLASDKGHTEIVKLLIPKVNITEITDIQILNLAKELSFKEIINLATDEDLAVVRELVPMLSATRATNYGKWIEVGTILHNIDHRLLDEWMKFSKKDPLKSHNEEWSKKWSRFGPTDLGIIALQEFALNDSPNAYEKWIASKEKVIDSVPKKLLKEIVAEMKSLSISSIEITKTSTIGVSKLDILDKMRSMDISKIQIIEEKVIIEFI